MSILQDNEFLERMLLSLGIPAILSASFFVWWIVDGSPEPQARVSSARRSSALIAGDLFAAGSFAVNSAEDARDSQVEATRDSSLVTVASHSASIGNDAASASESGENQEFPEDQDETERGTRRERFAALEQQFNDELRSGRREPQTADFLTKELNERFARLSSIEIDSNVVCTGSVCQVTLASAESLTTLLSSSSGTIHHLFPESTAGKLSESGLSEAQARFQARGDQTDSTAVQGIRLMIPRDSVGAMETAATASSSNVPGNEPVNHSSGQGIVSEQAATTDDRPVGRYSEDEEAPPTGDQAELAPGEDAEADASSDSDAGVDSDVVHSGASSDGEAGEE